MIISRKKFEKMREKIREEAINEYACAIEKSQEITVGTFCYDERIVNTITELKEDLEKKNKEIAELVRLIKEEQFKNKGLLETIAYYREKEFRNGVK